MPNRWDAGCLRCAETSYAVNPSISAVPLPAVSWVELDGTKDHQRRLVAARVRPPDGDGCVLIIGDSTSPESQRQFASQTPGAITVEAVDLRDLVSFARNFNLAAPDALERLAHLPRAS